MDDLLESGRRLLEQGERLLAGELELAPTDLAALYPGEMADPHLARIHRYFLERDAFGAFHADGSALADPSLLYGQTALPALARALAAVEAGPGDRFLDLGCGCGATVLWAAGRMERAVGVDLLPGAVDFARSAARDLGLGNATFLLQDLRHVDLAGSTLIFLAATAFPEDLCREVLERLQAAPAGTRVVSVSVPFVGGRLQDRGRQVLPFSWTGYGEPCPVEFFYSEVRDATTTQ